MPKHVFQVTGACHCGNVSLDIDWPGPVEDIKVRTCGCTFCQKHGGAWTSDPDATLRITIDDSSLLSRYRFGTETADFLLCRICGVVPAVVSEIDDQLYAVVNVHAFTNINTRALERSATDFDGEGTDSRLERRKKNWIATVTVHEKRTLPD